MEKTYLIAGKEYPFCEGIANYAVNSGAKVMVTLLDKKEKTATPTPSFVWNRSSPLSARALILETETTMGDIDTAFLIFDTALYVNDFEKMSLEVISRGIDTLFAGYMYLSVELLERFIKKGYGNICFVLKTHPSLTEALKQQKRTETIPAGPFVEAAASAFRAFAESIATKYAAASIGIQLIECPSSIDESTELSPWLFSFAESAATKPIVDAKLANRWYQVGSKPSSGWPIFKR